MKQRILVVEDQFIVSLTLAQILENEGFEVIGPAMSVTMARAIVGHVGCDAAVLDVNLHSGTAEPLAVELSARGIPFVVLTGSSLATLPNIFSVAPVLQKPLQADLLIAELNRCLGTIDTSKIAVF
jgi:DNA-binding NtrC family response regulator